MAEIDMKQLLYREIQDRQPRPTELLAKFGQEHSYRQIQDALSDLLQSGFIQLGTDRRLSVRRVFATP